MRSTGHPDYVYQPWSEERKRRARTPGGFWTDEQRCKVAKRMWLAGSTQQAIADKLGCTRNQVAGFIFRERLMRRGGIKIAMEAMVARPKMPEEQPSTHVRIAVPTLLALPAPPKLLALPPPKPTPPKIEIIAILNDDGSKWPSRYELRVNDDVRGRGRFDECIEILGLKIYVAGTGKCWWAHASGLSAGGWSPDDAVDCLLSWSRFRRYGGPPPKLDDFVLINWT